MLGALLAILILWIAPSLSAFKIIWDKSSASMINEYGVRASSCLNPLKGLKLPKGGPFSRTKYETEDIQSIIMLINFSWMPIDLRVISRESHSILSKTFDIASLDPRFHLSFFS